MSPYIAGCFDIRWDDPATLNTGPTFTTVAATGTLLVSGTPAVQVTATGSVTVTTTPLVAGQVLTIGGVDLTATAGARTPGANNFNATLGSVNLLAAEIAAALSDANNSFQGIVTASAAGAQVTLTAVDGGAAGNSVTLTTTLTGVLLSAATLTGGVDGDTVTINGLDLTAVSGARTSGNNDFSVDGTNFDVAQSLADAINDPANALVAYVSATAEFGEVTITSLLVGVLGNDIGLSTTSTVITASGTTLSGGLGTVDCLGESNSRWNIVGVNIYRSDTGERGPYFRLNSFPIGGTFFRDCTDNQLVEDELVNWEYQWIDKGDAANNRLWRFRTHFSPVVKREGQAIAADAPSDVIVSIDGQVVPVEAVFGPTGEVTLINRPTYDPSTEKIIPPVLPADDGSSEVLVTYYRKANFVRTDLEQKAKIFYRLTTVSIDPTGTTPSGYVETPLGHVPPVSPMNVEALDYIWRRAIKYNQWILEQGGERVKLFIQRGSGVRCPCQWDERLFEFSEQPTNNCADCYGTGWLGGYEGPIPLIIGPDEADRRVSQTAYGRRLEHNYEVWTGPSPMLSQRDFIVKQTGERYTIGPVRRPTVRGRILQQHFTLSYLDECDIRYQVPVVGTTTLPWPQTRYTRPEDAPCVESDPYPVGYDYEAVPMGTEVDKIPDGREQRGRTPVWANLTYGGDG
jgi:hypothetical protein